MNNDDESESESALYKRRVMDGFTAVGEALLKMLELGATVEDLRDDVRALLDRATMADPKLLPMLNRVAGITEDVLYDISNERPTTRALKHALEGAPAPLPGQAPAINAAVVLSSGHVIHGSLSVTPQGGLRLMSPSDRRAPDKIIMVEQFFDYSDVVCFGVEREIEVERSRIVQ